MKTSSFAILGGIAPYVAAFPPGMLEAVTRDPSLVARSEEFAKLIEARQAGANVAQAIFEPVNTFNANAQYVNVSSGSGHEWVAPSGNDLRGPCPGLNASESSPRHRSLGRS